MNVSLVAREAMEKEAARREEEELRGRLNELKESLKGKISTEDIVKTLRSSRDES